LFSPLKKLSPKPCLMDICRRLSV